MTSRNMLGPGTTLGGCRVVGLIGRGGMGAVYEARQLSLDRTVALKVLDPPADSEEREMQDRFLDEARLLARLSHPDIVSIYDAGRAGDIHFMVLELVEGITLRQVLSTEGALSAGRVHVIGAGVASGLAAAHRSGIVHGDIKPENILLTPLGEVKVADFGAARLAAAANAGKKVFATPAFAAPEVLRQEPVDGKADVYSLGLVLYRAAAGIHPFAGRDRDGLFRAQMEETPAPLLERAPGLHPDFAACIERMCAKRTGDRPSSDEVLAALNSHPEWAGPESAGGSEAGGPGGGSAAGTGAPGCPPGPGWEMPAPAEADGGFDHTIVVVPATDPEGNVAIGPAAAYPRPERGAAAAAAGSPAPPAGGLEGPRPKRSFLEAGLKKDLRAPPAGAGEPDPGAAAPSPVESRPPADRSPPVRVEEKKPDPRIADLGRQGRFLLMKKSWKEAEATFGAALGIDPGSTMAILGLARVFAATGRRDEAVAILGRAIEAGTMSAGEVLEVPQLASLRESEEFAKILAAHPVGA